MQQHSVDGNKSGASTATAAHSFMNIVRVLVTAALLLLPICAGSTSIGNLTIVFCSQWQFGHVSPMLLHGETTNPAPPPALAALCEPCCSG
jgi:hypothetical protein